MKLTFSGIALAMAGLNTHLFFSRNGTIIDGTVSNFAILLAVQGGWMTLPLLIAASQAPFRPSTAASWPLLISIAIGLWLDVEIGASHVALLLYPCLFAASWYLAIKCFQGRLHWIAVPVVLIFYSITPFIATFFGSYSRN
jgi:hypothetical protein